MIKKIEKEEEEAMQEDQMTGGRHAADASPATNAVVVRSTGGSPTCRLIAVDDALHALQPQQTHALLTSLDTAILKHQPEGTTTNEGKQRRLCIATSLPDYSEFVSSRMTLVDWKKWFISAAVDCLRCCLGAQEEEDAGGCCIFYQTDIVVEGVHVSKAFLIMQAAAQVGENVVSLRWHKIACRVPPGSIGGGGVAAFSHVLCFSRSAVFVQPADRQSQVPDVLPDTGDTSWARGTGATTCLMIAQYLASCAARRSMPVASLVLFDPFCGHGSLLAAANAVGLDCIGVELSAKRARKAMKIRLALGSRGQAASFEFEGDRNPSTNKESAELGIEQQQK